MGEQLQVEDTSVRNIGRILIFAALCAATWLVFSDLISYWTGLGSSRITGLDVSKLTFIRDDRVRFGGPGVHFKEIKYYKTPEGGEVGIFQADGDNQSEVFVRGRQKVFHDEGFEEVTTYEPFIAWSYVLKRGAVLVILCLLIFAVAGLALKLMDKGQLIRACLKNRGRA